MLKLDFIKAYRNYSTVHDLSLFKIFYLWLASFIMISALYLVDSLFLNTYDTSLLIAPFAASVVILLIVPHSAFARPRALIGGHILAAFIGMSLYFLFGSSGYVAALAVSTSLVAMLITDTIHPPASATAFSLIFADQQVYAHGYYFLLIPCLLGTIILWLTSYAIHKLYALHHLRIFNKFKFNKKS